MNSTKRITKKVMVTLLYTDLADEMSLSKVEDVLTVGKEYRLLAVDGYHGYAYIKVEGWETTGYCVTMEQVGLKNT